jgi:hypothetical protein
MENRDARDHNDRTIKATDGPDAKPIAMIRIGTGYQSHPFRQGGSLALAKLPFPMIKGPSSCGPS